MTDPVSTLLTQAQERQKAHWRTETGVCFECGRLWLCPDRVFADAVVVFVENQATRDTQIRTALLLGQVREVNGGELESIETIYTPAGVLLVQRQAISKALALLDPARESGGGVGSSHEQSTPT